MSETKTISDNKAVLELRKHEDHIGATFSRDDDDSFYTHIVSVDSKTFKELGSPEQITITIEPGDKLNGD